LLDFITLNDLLVVAAVIAIAIAVTLIARWLDRRRSGEDRDG
jgi:hypothetical protein